VDITDKTDLADNYEQPGELYSRMQRDEDAEKSLRAALRRNPKTDGAYLGWQSFIRESRNRSKL